MAPHVAVYGVDVYGDENAVYGSESSPPQEFKIMSQDNKIEVVVAPADKASVIQKAGEIATLTPWRVNIPAGEKNRYAAIGTERAGMDQVFAEQMDAHPDLVPPYVDTAAIPKDIQFRRDVAEMLAVLMPLVEGLQDAALLASSDCFNAYSAFKASVDAAAKRNAPGADTIKAALDVFFPGRPRKTTPPAS